MCLKVTLQYYPKMYTWKIITLGSFPVESGSTDIKLGLIWSFLCHFCAYGFWCQSNSLSFVLWLQEQFFSTISIGTFPSLWVLCPLAKPTDFLFSSSHFPEGLICGAETGPFNVHTAARRKKQKSCVLFWGDTCGSSLFCYWLSEIFLHHPGRFSWLSQASPV